MRLDSSLWQRLLHALTSHEHRRYSCDEYSEYSGIVAVAAFDGSAYIGLRRFAATVCALFRHQSRCDQVVYCETTPS